MRVRWEDVLAGYPDEHMHFEADASDGYFKVTMNDRAIFEGSQSDAFVTFIALSRLFGPKLSKSLLKIRLDGERLTNDGRVPQAAVRHLEGDVQTLPRPL